VTAFRPLREDDVPAAHEVSLAAFEDYARRRGDEVPPRPDPRHAHIRLRRFLIADPDGAWVAEEPDGTLSGVGLALLRAGLWGLSLLVVDPARQSDGIGRELLARTLAYGEQARGAIILASSDPRALRAYTRAGFTMHPTAAAQGRPRGVEPAPEVRPFVPCDHAMAADVDRAVRGAPHGEDLDVLATQGCRLLAFPDRGYAVLRGGEVKLIAAHDEEAAAALLRTALAQAEGTAVVEWLTGRQQWATDVVVSAGLALEPAGAVFVRGDVGRLRPYLPSGAYL
jgi:GNAT superfamily N-acetyltransferase